MKGSDCCVLRSHGRTSRRLIALHDPIRPGCDRNVATRGGDLLLRDRPVAFVERADTLLQLTPQHPGRLLVPLHALREQVRGGHPRSLLVVLPALKSGGVAHLTEIDTGILGHRHLRNRRNTP